MNKLIAFISTLILFNVVYASGQDRLILKHKKKTHKKRTIDLSRSYEIKTADTTFFSKIVAFTDSTLSVVSPHKTGRDTTYTYSYTRPIYNDSYFLKWKKVKDSTYTYSTIQPIYRQDTTVILFSKVRVIKKDWFRNPKWVEPFAWLSLGPIMGVVLLPVAAIDQGAKGVNDWAAFEAVMIGICAPPLFLGSRNTKYDLIKKWTIKTE